jgi:hypothetical protein
LAYFFTDQIKAIMADVHRAERWLGLAGLLALAAMLVVGVWRWHRRVGKERLDEEPPRGTRRRPERSEPRPITGSKDERIVDPFYAVVRVIARFWIWFFFERVEVRHPEQVPRMGPVLLCINHPNNLIDSLLQLTGSIADAVEHFRTQDPERIERLWQRILGYHAGLAAYRLRVEAVRTRLERTAERQRVARSWQTMVGLPLFAYGAAVNFLPYSLPGWLAGRMSRRQTDYATTRLLASVVAFPLF